jgi:hypothetical protein
LTSFWLFSISVFACISWFLVSRSGELTTENIAEKRKYMSAKRMIIQLVRRIYLVSWVCLWRRCRRDSRKDQSLCVRWNWDITSLAVFLIISLCVLFLDDGLSVGSTIWDICPTCIDSWTSRLKISSIMLLHSKELRSDNSRMRSSDTRPSRGVLDRYTWEPGVTSPLDMALKRYPVWSEFDNGVMLQSFSSNMTLVSPVWANTRYCPMMTASNTPVDCISSSSILCTKWLKFSEMKEKSVSSDSEDHSIPDIASRRWSSRTLTTLSFSPYNIQNILIESLGWSLCERINFPVFSHV